MISDAPPNATADFQVLHQLRQNDHLAEEVGTRLGTGAILLEGLPRTKTQRRGPLVGNCDSRSSCELCQRIIDLPERSSACGRPGRLARIDGARTQGGSQARGKWPRRDHPAGASCRTLHCQRAGENPACSCIGMRFDIISSNIAKNCLGSQHHRADSK